MKQSKGKWETVFFFTSTLVRNSKVHSQTWQSALWADRFDWSDLTNAKTYTQVHQTQMWENWEKKTNQDFVFCSCKRLQATSSPQCGQFPFRAVKSLLHNPLSTLTTKTSFFISVQVNDSFYQNRVSILVTCRRCNRISKSRS